MVRIPIFIDSSVIVAFHNKDDENHDKATRIMREIAEEKYGKAYLSDYIFDECVTVALLKLKSLKEASALGNALLKSELTMLKATEGVIQEAWEIFQTRNPGKLSFTDCTTIAFVEMLRIEHLATFDREFEKIQGIKIIGL